MSEKILSLGGFKAELLKRLGDSPEAKELTDAELAEFHADYFKSGQTFNEWFDSTAGFDDEKHLHVREIRNWIIDLQSFGVEAYSADEARRKAIARLESGEEKACVDAVIEDDYDVQEERGKRD